MYTPSYLPLSVTSCDTCGSVPVVECSVPHCRRPAQAEPKRIQGQLQPVCGSCACWIEMDEAPAPVVRLCPPPVVDRVCVLCHAPFLSPLCPSCACYDDSEDEAPSPVLRPCPSHVVDRVCVLCQTPFLSLLCPACACYDDEDEAAPPGLSIRLPPPGPLTPRSSTSGPVSSRPLMMSPLPSLMSLVTEPPALDDEDYSPPPWNDVYEGPCEDCGAEPAETVFHHMDNRRFALCLGCYWQANHEEDYLQDLPCACLFPEPTPVGDCDRCSRPLSEAVSGPDEDDSSLPESESDTESESAEPGYSPGDPSYPPTPEGEPLT